MIENRTFLVWAILLSLLLHWLGAVSPNWLPQSWFLPAPASRDENIVEIDVQSPLEEKAQQQQFVPSIDDVEKPVEDPEKLREQARFLSDRLRRFKEELQASVRGETKNRPNLKPQFRSRDSVIRPDSGAENPVTEFEDRNGNVVVERDLLRKPRSAPQFSTIGENLPKDLRKGMFNVLNTDYLTFYSFYERFGSMIRFTWARQLEGLANNAQLRQQLNSSNNREWTTELKVWLKPNGEILRVAVMKPSGIPMIDKAHQQTFYDVGLVPNPPKEMVKEDGTIPIDVGLTIFYTPE